MNDGKKNHTTEPILVSRPFELQVMMRIYNVVEPTGLADKATVKVGVGETAEFYAAVPSDDSAEITWEKPNGQGTETGKNFSFTPYDHDEYGLYKVTAVSGDKKVVITFTAVTPFNLKVAVTQNAGGISLTPKVTDGESGHTYSYNWKFMNLDCYPDGQYHEIPTEGEWANVATPEDQAKGIWKMSIQSNDIFTAGKCSFWFHARQNPLY